MRTKRKGGNRITRKLREWGMYNASSTSALAREIYSMLDVRGIRPEKENDFFDLMHVHPEVNVNKLMKALEKKGATAMQRADILYRFNEKN